MQASLFHFGDNDWKERNGQTLIEKEKVQLILCFGDKESLKDKNLYPSLRQLFRHADIAFCSSAGEIYQKNVRDNTVIAVAIAFDHTTIKSACINIKDHANSKDAAIQLRKDLPEKDLCYMMVLSDGALVNGSELVKGFNEGKEDHILVTGGLAGDGAQFISTLVGLNEAPAEGKLMLIGFYGKHLKVTHGSNGGWEMFGLQKEITKSTGNILYEIGGVNALGLYKQYLGPEAQQLPKSALFFPISVTLPGSTKPVVRTILSIDEENKSMVFAGDVQQGSKVRFMRANFEKIILAAATAAVQTLEGEINKPVFSLLVSCVGRKLVLGPRIEEEIEAVAEVFGDETVLAGFYSYGEISPFNEGGQCQLHNQTMTITSFYELP